MPSYRRLAILTCLPVALIVFLLASRPSGRVALADSPTWLDVARSLWPGITTEEVEVETAVKDTWQRHSQRVVAVGPLYSDFASTLRTLRLASVINAQGQWIGRRAVLVFVGNTLDYGKDTIALQRYLKNLKREANRVGGSVVLLLGQREMRNALGNWADVSEEEMLSFGGERQRQFALSDLGSIGQGFLSEYVAAARVGYTTWYNRTKLAETTGIKSGTNTSTSHFMNPFRSPDTPADKRVWLPEHLEHIPAQSDALTQVGCLFVSAGFPPSWLSVKDPIATWNLLAKSLLLQLIAFPLQRFREVPSTATADEKRLVSRNGPFWFDGYTKTQDEVQVCNDVMRVLQKMQASRIIVSQTGTSEALLSRCGGKIILLPNISPARGGAVSAVEISYNLRAADLNTTHARFKESESVRHLKHGRVSTLLVRAERRFDMAREPFS